MPYRSLMLKRQKNVKYYVNRTDPHPSAKWYILSVTLLFIFRVYLSLGEGPLNLLHLSWYNCLPLQSRWIPILKVLLAVNFSSSLGKGKKCRMVYNICESVLGTVSRLPSFWQQRETIGGCLSFAFYFQKNKINLSLDLLFKGRKRIMIHGPKSQGLSSPFLNK